MERLSRAIFVFYNVLIVGWGGGKAVEPSAGEPVMPKFDVPVLNVTVVEGNDAVLPCKIKFLGNFQVIWTNSDGTVLTLQGRTMVSDQRISVPRPYFKEWNMHIARVKYEDQGTYHCKVNTNPQMGKTVGLHVMVPSKIIDRLSSGDKVVKEGDSVKLVCNVTGVPYPQVTWFKQPKYGTDKEQSQIKDLEGETLIIHNVTRECDGIYQCVAWNGVKPAVIRKMMVSIQYAPEIRLPNQFISQMVGKEVILECLITAEPLANNFWEFNSREVIRSDEREEGKKIKHKKHDIEVFEENANTIMMALTIRSLKESDFGEYTCVAANKYGKDQQTMTLHQYKEPIIISDGFARPTETPRTTLGGASGGPLNVLPPKEGSTKNINGENEVTEGTEDKTKVEVEIDKKKPDKHGIMKYGIKTDKPQKPTPSSRKSTDNNGNRQMATLNLLVVTFIICLSF